PQPGSSSARVIAYPAASRGNDDSIREKSAPSTNTRGSVFEVVRDRGDDGALAEEQAALEEQRALVVEELAPPVAHDELRQHHGDDVVVVPGIELVDEPQDRARQLAVGRMHDL